MGLDKKKTSLDNNLNLYGLLIGLTLFANVWNLVRDSC